MAEGLEIAAVPRARGPGRRLDRRRGLARGRARGRAGRDRQPAPPRPAAGGAARPAGARSCTATSTPGCASSPRASSTRSSSPPPGCAGSGARARSASRSRSTEMVPAPGQGALALQVRDRRRGQRRGRGERSATTTALRELTAERAAVAPLEASCATPIGVHARVEGERLSDRRLRRPARRQRVAARPGRGRRRGPRRRRPRAGRAPARRRRPRAPRPRRGARRHERAGAGVVYLVGAGPGDPGLMTARSLALIAERRRRLLRPADPAGGAGRRPRGRRAGLRRQAAGRALGAAGGDRRAAGRGGAGPGKSVVRLKGGDPFVFGRGGEEGEALRAAGVEFEVVPGRHRRRRRHRLRRHPGHPPRRRLGGRLRHRPRGPREGRDARSTGRRSPRFPGTLVFYMGVKRLAENAAALIAAGRDPEEPAAAIERGTMAGPAHRRRDPGDDRRGGRARGDRRAGADRRRRGRRPPRGAGLARAAAAARPPRRRHPGPRPGQRPRRDPARPRRRGGRAAGDPDRAADRDASEVRDARSPRSASTR